MGSANLEKKWLFPLVISSCVCLFLLATSLNLGLVSSPNKLISSMLPSRVATNQTSAVFVETRVSQAPPPPAVPPPPRFAYLISGSKGDLEKLWRTLRALYHPLNHYVLHLDLKSPVAERLELASRVQNETFFNKFGNVYMITKANMVTFPVSPTNVNVRSSSRSIIQYHQPTEAHLKRRPTNVVRSPKQLNETRITPLAC